MVKHHDIAICSQAAVKHDDADWVMLTDATTRHLPGTDSKLAAL